MRMIVFILLLVFLPTLVGADILLGGSSVYTVKQGDTIEKIGSRLGVDWRIIVKENGLDIKKPIRKGQELIVTTKKIVPAAIENGIIINIPDRMLYFFREHKLELAFPVGLGKAPRKGSRDWSTPVGKFSIVSKQKDPTWYVPESIQLEMEESGKPVETIVPPGPDNPLGRYAMKTSIPGIMIHETIWPGSIYQFRSHGCIRVAPEHMAKLFPQVEKNTLGELLYMPVKVAVADGGRVFLEVHRDIYARVRDLEAEVKVLIEKNNAMKRVDWGKVDKIIRERAGVAEDVTL